MSIRTQIWWGVLVLAVAPACSAIVSPDESELGGEGVGTDGGTTDGAEPDVFVPPVDGGTDAGSECPEGCDDGVPCTIDRCVDGECTRMPSDEACGTGQRCNPASGCVPIVCAADTDCDDGLACNGTETCDPSSDGADEVTGCVSGAAPVCDDGFACTTDACEEDAGGCVSTPVDSACDDSIECTVDICDPAEADDGSGCVITENDAFCDTGFCITGGRCSIEEAGCVGGDARDCTDGSSCTADSCDASASMCVNAPLDEDGDGAPVARVGGTDCAGGTDCDDTDATIHPGATEYCNSRDDDCDDSTDEGCTPIPDDCGDAEQIVLDAAGNATLTGSMNVFTPDYGTLCGDSGGRDAVYYVDITSLSDVTIETIGSTADTVLAVGRSCGNSGFRMGCDDDIDTGVNRASRIWVHRIGPEIGTSSVRLYILLDTFNGSSSGDFTLNVRVRGAAADSCATPINITGGGALVGRTGFATGVGSQVGSCQSPTDASTEAIATFVGPPDGNFRFVAISTDFDPDLYVRSAPCNSGTEVGCVAGDGDSSGIGYYTRYDDASTPGSNYFLFVDGAGSNDDYFVSYEP